MNPKLLPMLATEWEASDDGLEYTFHLRPDAVWVTYSAPADNVAVQRPVTAQDVVYGLRRTLSLRSDSAISSASPRQPRLHLSNRPLARVARSAAPRRAGRKEARR